MSFKAPFNSHTDEAHEDVKPIISAALGTPLGAEGVQLSSLWSRDALNHVPLEYLLNLEEGFECLRWRYAHFKDPGTCVNAYAKYIQNMKEFFLIPKILECDRVFLRNRADAAYVEAASRFLRGVSSMFRCIKHVANTRGGGMEVSYCWIT